MYELAVLPRRVSVRGVSEETMGSAPPIASCARFLDFRLIHALPFNQDDLRHDRFNTALFRHRGMRLNRPVTVPNHGHPAANLRLECNGVVFPAPAR